MALTNCALWLSDRYSVIGTQLSWTDATYNNIVTDTLEYLGIATEAEVEAKILHAVGKMVLFEKALSDVSLDITFSADGASYNRSDLHAQLTKQYEDAASVAMQYVTKELTIDLGEQRNPYIYDESRDLAGNY